MKKVNWLFIFWGIVLIVLASLGISYAMQKRRNSNNSNNRNDLIIGTLANSSALLVYNLSQKNDKTQKQEFSDEFSDEFL